MEISLTVYADVADEPKSQPLDELSGRAQPHAIYVAAAEGLKAQIQTAFNYCKGIEFDAFDAIGKLQKQENKQVHNCCTRHTIELFLVYSFHHFLSGRRVASTILN